MSASSLAVSPASSKTNGFCSPVRLSRLLSMLLCLTPAAILAQGFPPTRTVLEQVPVGNTPQAVAVNPATNKIYVANSEGDNVTIIDGATGNPTFVAAGANPSAVAVNTVTNKIYVANSGGVDVDVIDGATNTVTSLVVGEDPKALAVNPVTNKIYVANSESDNVTIIDGATNATTTVAVGITPRAVAVNPVTNQIYVANFSSNNMTVIDGASNATSTIAVGTNPYAVAVNPVTNKIYVVNNGSGNVTVIDGASSSTTTVASGAHPFAVAVNPVSNQIYIANYESNNVTVMDGATNNTYTLATGVNPASITIDTLTNQIYIACQSSTDLTIINGWVTNATQTEPLGGYGLAVAVNPVTHKIYAANQGSNSFGSNNVAVIDGTWTATSPTSPNGLFVQGHNVVLANPATNKTYSDYFDSSVGSGTYKLSVFDGTANTVTNIPFSSVSRTFVQLALDPVTNKIFAAVNQSDGNCGATMIDAATNAVTCITLPGGSVTSQVNTDDMALDPMNHRAYFTSGVPNSSSYITVVDTNTGAVITTQAVPYALVQRTESSKGQTLSRDTIAVNPVTNKIYFIVNGQGAGAVVMDGTTFQLTQLPAPQNPSTIAVNPDTNKIYVANTVLAVGGYDSLTVIDGETNNGFTFKLGQNNNPLGAGDLYIAINPLTNKIYVSDNQANTVAVVDGVNDVMETLVPETGFSGGNPVGLFPFWMQVDMAANKVYVVGQGNAITILDGATNATTQLNENASGGNLSINSVTHQVYILNPTWGTNAGVLSVLTPIQVVANPLTTTVTPLPGNVTSSTSPTFNFTATSSFAPIAPPVQNVYYQLDTMQGPWIPATGTAPNFTGALSNVPLGNHVLYFYATDGSDSSGLAIGTTSIGATSGYAFSVQ